MLSAIPLYADEYEETLASGARTKARLTELYATAEEARRPDVVARARADVHSLIIDEIFSAWIGTRWDFDGTSQTPREGRIACGYFVSTVLRDAGFDVEAGQARPASGRDDHAHAHR